MVLHHESFQKIYKLVPRYHQYVLWKKSKFEIKALDENKILQFCFENLNAHSNPLSYNLKIMKVLDHSVENCIFVKNCFSCSLLPIFSHIYFSHRFTFLQYNNFIGPVSARSYKVRVVGNNWLLGWLLGWLVMRFPRNGPKDFSDFFHEVRGLWR